jgi:hypothetical protein
MLKVASAIRALPIWAIAWSAAAPGERLQWLSVAAVAGDCDTTAHKAVMAIKSMNGMVKADRRVTTCSIVSPLMNQPTVLLAGVDDVIYIG